MIAICPSCSWPSPTVVSAHGSVRYLRCVCGQWLVSEHGSVVATAGTSTLTACGTHCD
ncbi:hypothetical protein OG874_42315 [Nocardia sp. NBC_00565]|uniref:hypothetical protein n=1 Tax=Nocardia sp. NBC_00565 TaxID=2975993 RepID=UPI002E817EBC|nr:hypothetical protein [Nocardia sp. NBC_00565]WUC03225.1 hypothetical protein OG874_42315 [Nocardia sp. NBC_00565]